MNTTIYSFTILIAILAILIVYCAHMRIRIMILRKKLADSYHKRAETTRFMDIFARNLRGNDEVDTWMNTAARYVGDLVEAQSVCVFALEGEYLRAVGVFGAFPLLSNRRAGDYVLTKPKYILETLKRERCKIGTGFIGEVAEKREDVFLPDPTVDPRISDFLNSAVPIHSLMAVPLVNEGQVSGVICAVNSKRMDMPFTTEQFGRFKFIASQVVLAQNIIQVYSTLSEQQRINQELTFARNLQLSLMPKRFPMWGRFIIHAFTRASKEVSGDFYDFVQIDDDRLLVVIGDACGKGIPACMIMAMTRSFIRANIGHFTSLKALLRELNTNLYRDTVDERYITLGCCLIDKKESTIEYARAGHTPLLLYLREHTRAINPDGSALGLLPSELSDFDTLCTEVTPQTTMLMFTDGINEATNERDEFFGIPRLTAIYKNSCVRGDSLEGTIDTIMKAVDSYSEVPKDQEDDQTMVLIKHI